ncbi:unnamed protein product [Clavelina lepadiformis]|uniref:Uncharacterized protein n=1 Tax=Clavelina lepadiformis TaxID=159417 RepID=A0ABP0GIU0_CLALP
MWIMEPPRRSWNTTSTAQVRSTASRFCAINSQDIQKDSLTSSLQTRTRWTPPPRSMALCSVDGNSRYSHVLFVCLLTSHVAYDVIIQVNPKRTNKHGLTSTDRGRARYRGRGRGRHYAPYYRPRRAFRYHDVVIKYDVMDEMFLLAELFYRGRPRSSWYSPY